MPGISMFRAVSDALTGYLHLVRKRRAERVFARLPDHIQQDIGLAIRHHGGSNDLSASI
jgi:hypothetical protein